MNYNRTTRLIVGIGLGLCLASSFSPPQAQAISVTKVLGASIACDPSIETCTPLPLTVTVLCAVSCTRLSSPDWTNPSRWWGTDLSNCRTSTNGGLGWANCASNPDPAALYHYAGTGDGNVIAAGITNGGTRCKIYKSINAAVSWSLVYDEVMTNCGAGTASGGTRLKCGPNGNCALNLLEGSTGLAVVLFSSDNGDNWTKTTITNIVYEPASLAYDGLLGFGTPQTSNGFSNYKAFRAVGTSWTLSSGWPLVQLCWPSILMNGGGYSACQVGAAGTSYDVRDHNGALVATVSLPDASPLANAGMLGVSPVGTALYLITNDNNGGGARIGVWVTRTGLANGPMIRIFTGSAVTGMTDQADVNYAHGCIWFSAGTATPIFAKICR